MCVVLGSGGQNCALHNLLWFATGNHVFYIKFIEYSHLDIIFIHKTD